MIALDMMRITDLSRALTDQRFSIAISKTSKRGAQNRPSDRPLALSEPSLESVNLPMGTNSCGDRPNSGIQGTTLKPASPCGIRRARHPMARRKKSYLRASARGIRRRMTRDTHERGAADGVGGETCGFRLRLRFVERLEHGPRSRGRPNPQLALEAIDELEEERRPQAQGFILARPHGEARAGEVKTLKMS